MINWSEDCYSNDFEIIAEPEMSQDYERSGSETYPSDMSSSGELDTNAHAGKTRKMDLNEIHSRREIQWNKEKEELLKKIKTLEKELEQNNEDISARSEQDETRIREIEAKYPTLQIRKRQKDQMLTELRSRLAEMETQYKNLQNEKQDLESNIESEQQKNVHYTGRIRVMEESIKKKDEQIDELKRKVEEQENSHKKLREIKNKLEEEQNEMKTARNNSQSVVGIKDQENVKLEITCKELKRELGDRKEQNRVLQEEKDKLDDELIKMQLKVNEMGNQKDFREKYELSEKKRKELTETVNALTKAKEQFLEKVQNENAQLTQAMNALTQESNVLRERSHQLQKKLEQKNKDILARRDENETRICEIEAKYAILGKEYEELADRHKDLQSKYKDLQTENQNCQRQKYEMLSEQKEDFRERYECSEKKRQELTETVAALTEKSEHYQNNTQNESQHLTQALNALNQENDVLRERMHQLESENSALKSCKLLLETQIRDVKDELSRLRNRDANGSQNSRTRDGTNSRENRRASSQSPQSTFRANNDSDQQWYTTHHGEKVLHEIYQGLKDIFPSIELSRDSATKNISIFITMDGGKSASVLFPKDFPLSHLQLKCGGRMRQLKFRYDSSKSSHSQFSAEVSKRLCEIILS